MLAHEARFLGEPCDHACRYYDRMRFERARKQQRERADWLAMPCRARAFVPSGSSRSVSTKGFNRYRKGELR